MTETATKAKEKPERSQAPFRLDPKVHKTFKEKCEKECRTMNGVLNTLVKMYNEGKVKLP